MKTLIHTLSTTVLVGASAMSTNALADKTQQMTFNKDASRCHSYYYCPFQADLNNASAYTVKSVTPNGSSSGVKIDSSWTDNNHVVIQPHSDGTIPSINTITASVTLSTSGPTPPATKGSFHLKASYPQGLENVRVQISGPSDKSVTAIAGDNTVSNLQAGDKYQLALPKNVLYSNNGAIYNATCHLSSDSITPSSDGSQTLSLTCNQGAAAESTKINIQANLSVGSGHNATLHFSTTNPSTQFTVTQSLPFNQATVINLPNQSLQVSAEPITIAGTTYTAQNYSHTFTPASGAAEIFNFAKSNVPQVKGWPSTHISMGNLTNGTAVALSKMQAANVPVDTVFKYAGPNGGGDRGKLIYPTFTNEAIHQAMALGTNSLPTMVIYTAQMSGGTNFCDFANSTSHPSINCNEEVSYNLDKHLTNLALLAQMLQKSGRAGSIVLNPDLLGQITQNNLSSDLDSMQIDVQQATNLAYYMATDKPQVTMTIKYPNGSTEKHTFTGTLYDDYQWLFTNVYNSSDYWDAAFGDYMTNLMDTAFNQALSKASTKPADVPIFNNNSAGWIQANNWLIQYFGGKQVSYGWLENMWAPNTGNWIHNGKMSDSDITNDYTKPVMSVINKYKIYDGTFRPDYIAFDKYEKDVIPGAVSDWLYNQDDWSNYLQAVKQVSEATGKNYQATPVMLFQLPGGHVLTAQNDPAEMAEHISTAPDYIFGDQQLGKDFSGAVSVIEPLLKNQNYLSYPLSNNYNCNNCTIKSYLSKDKQDWTTPHIDNLLASHVFAVLWGGGTGPTTSMTSYPVDDDGWMAAKINQYEGVANH